MGSHNRKLGKWILVLSKFDLRYESAKAIKGQVMADFVAQDCSPEVSTIELAPWTLFFDGSSCVKGCGIGVILISPGGGDLIFVGRLILHRPTIRVNIKLSS